MITAPGGKALVGRVVRLDPSHHADAEELFAALDHAEVWAAGYAGGPAARPSSPDGWRERIDAARADGRAMYTVRLVDNLPRTLYGNSGTSSDERPKRRTKFGKQGEVVGTTSLGDVDLGNERVHLGWTAYSPFVWGTAVNPECKLLLLRHAFDDCGFGRVKIQTDLLNLRSQAAIAKLGAQREGVLRRHIKRADGTWRDTVVFSVVVDEWPAVEAGLVARVDAATGRVTPA
jgi:RimJ/RimL family protein N-acetyltransferase